MRNRIKYLFILLLALGSNFLFFPRCANIVPPTGGPQDTIPPRLIRSYPPNFSTGFTQKEILLEFDEFIQLRNINNQFIITPPQEKNPDFRVRGNNLRVNLKSDLIPNTTYTLNFGDAITDLNEGNILNNYEFVFSTGDIIDSLDYSGFVLDAYDNEPVEGVVVMLYDKLHDSIPYNEIPLYANRTNKDGRFQLNNLRAETFKVFALKNEGNNYLYRRVGEEAIAFLDDHISPDTLIQGKTTKSAPPSNDLKEIISKEENESPASPEQKHESIKKEPVINFRSGDTLYIFREETGRQFISRNERTHRGELLFVFARPLKKRWSIEPVNFEPPENWKLVEKNPQMDSIRYWIADSKTRDMDNMKFLVSYWATGPSDSLAKMVDTLNMNYTDPSRSRRAAAAEEDDQVMDVNFEINEGGHQELHKNLKVSFPVPLELIDLSKITVSTIGNNDIVDRNFELIQDSLRIRDYHLVTDWLPGNNYKFFAGPGAFKDIFGLVSDSINFSFQTREDDHYGRILLAMTGIDNHKIIQLLDKNDFVIREYFIEEDGEVIIDYLQPQNYRLKLIFDANNNKKWDTGNYLKRIQPERVSFFQDIITVRSNWDIEVEWNPRNHQSP